MAVGIILQTANHGQNNERQRDSEEEEEGRERRKSEERREERRDQKISRYEDLHAELDINSKVMTPTNIYLRRSGEKVISNTVYTSSTMTTSYTI